MSKLFCFSTKPFIGFEINIAIKRKISIFYEMLITLNIFNISIFFLALRKKFMQQNFLCCSNKTFCLSNQNLIDIAKCFIGTTKEFLT